MSSLPLARIETNNLEIVANDRDLLQDVAIFLEYVHTHSIKRMVRTNQLPKGDLLRIARLLGDPELERAVKETGGAQWIDLINALVRNMGLTSYNTKGEYIGYSSASPSFYDNFVLVNEKAYRNFLALAPIDQEKRLLNALVNRISDENYHQENEFFQTGVLGALDPFSPFGAATGVMPTLDIAAIRRFLLDLLTGCEAGVWYSTASLVAYLKANHPYFLIPETLKPDRWGKVPERYSTFHDGPNRWSNKHVPSDAPDAFERIEGRYVERFLEGIPLELRFVEVAYSQQPYEGLYPQMGHLQAFRINERFLRLMQGQIAPPRVSVLPNFDVIVESEIYPAGLMNQLDRLAERASTSNNGRHMAVITLQLKKERIAAELVRNPDLDVSAVLREWSKRDLPANVAVELQAWSGHAEQFILYQGFGLLESADPLPEADPFTVEPIKPGLRLIRQPQRLFETLKAAAWAPLAVEHGNTFTPLPEKASTCFPHQSAQSLPSGPQPLQIGRSTLVSLHFPSEQSFEDIRKALAEARCPIQVDIQARVIRFAQHHQPIFLSVLAQLSDRYQVDIQDLIQ